MYKISVRLEGIERRKKSTGLFHIIAGFFIIGNAGSYLNQMNYELFGPILPLYGIAILSFVYGFFRKKIDPVAKYNQILRWMQLVTFLVLGFIFLSFANTISIISLFLWALIILLLMRTEKKVFGDADIRLTEDGIFIPGYFSDHRLSWDLVEDFVVRNDFVTITRINQHYVQLEILKAIDTLEISNINSYCQQQIESQNNPLLKEH